MESNQPLAGNDYSGFTPTPPTRKRRIGRSVGLIVILAAVLLGSMLLLPLAILWFIDPSLADTFLAYSAPYMVAPILVILAILVVASILREAVRKPGPDQASLAQTPQYEPRLTIETHEHPDQVVQIREREIVREIVKVRCHYCGTLNFETATKCESCGANL